MRSMRLLACVAAATGLGALAGSLVLAQPQPGGQAGGQAGGQPGGPGGPRGGGVEGMAEKLVEGLKSVEGCLGVETARTQGGKNLIVAWFRDAAAARAW